MPWWRRRKPDTNDFTLDDFRKELATLQRIAVWKELVEMIREVEDPEIAARHIRGMIDAMTPEERRQAEIIDGPRLSRIALGSGVEFQDVERLIGEFLQLRRAMRDLARMTYWQRLKMVLGLRKVGTIRPGAGNDV
jgi:signal recognition particle subunit SRP54